MPIFLEISVHIPQISGVFHYHLSPEIEKDWEADALVGKIVTVPFGQRMVHGVVLRTVAKPAVTETRPVASIVDPEVGVTRLQIELAQRISETTLSSLAECIGLMMPPGLAQQADTLYELKNGGGNVSKDGNASSNTGRSRLLELLSRRGALRGQQIDRALPRVDWRQAARTLERQGVISAQPVLPEPRVRPKVVRTAQLACPLIEAQAALSGVARQGSQALGRRQAALHHLMREVGSVDVAWLQAETGVTSADLRALEKLGLVRLGESEVWRDPLAASASLLENKPEWLSESGSAAPVLTYDQQVVWDELLHGIEMAAEGQAVKPMLLHGVTGSGKTEIYLRAVEETLRRGKQTIVLVPEIALTPQTVRRFLLRFPGQVGVLHSQLSDGERYDTWRRARQGRLGVVVGPRSALFAPMPALGLVVVDECHDDSYYQGETPPYYHARETAVLAARLAGAVCLLGSATPDLESAHHAVQKEWIYLRLPARILAHTRQVQSQLERIRSLQGEKNSGVSHYQPLEANAEAIHLPPVKIVDMRQELHAGNRSIFSRDLFVGLKRVLEMDQQAILFLNRRGTATFVFCRDCGYAVKCPRCDLPLIYHEPQAVLVCHHCNYQRKLPAVCPACGGRNIRQFGTGTEKVEAEVQAAFPGVRTLRWDYETTRRKRAHEIILEHFSAHRADVLVGTQMLAKGLDLPLVTLVGVILADVGLNLPDYRAGERTFQLLTQVAGRAGRSPLGGEVIFQTFQPEHYVIQAAAKHDYRSFYQQEMDYRRHLGYPPFTRLARLEYRHHDADQAERVAKQMAALVHTWFEAEQRRSTQVIGPAPCFFARVGGAYRWQIVLRGPDPASILRGRTLGEWRIEINPPSLL